MQEFIIIGIAQCLFFILFLSLKKTNLIANKLLILWISLIGFSLFLNYLYLTKGINKVPELIGLDTAFPFLYGPILFLYTYYLTRFENSFSKRQFYHFVPFILYFVYVFFTFYMQSDAYKLVFLEKIQKGIFPFDLKIAIYLKFIQASIYLLFTYRLLKSFQFKIENNFSTIEKINLKWLLTILYSLSFVYLIKFICICLPFVGVDINIGQTEALSDMAVVLFIWLIAFKGIAQVQPFQTPLSMEEENVISTNPNVTVPKYQNSIVDESKSNEYYSLLKAYMKEEQPFLDPLLTITMLSEKIKLPSKIVSQIINENTGGNFFNYINSFRVEEVKCRLKDESFQHLTILGIALDCGFNSKSAFNNVFKKMTGLTPSEYVKQHH